jgi:hypothetical protein
MRAILIALAPALTLWLWSRAGAGVETIYARGVYPPLARALQAVAGLLPFSLFEVLVFAGVAALLGLAARAARRREGRVYLRGLLIAGLWIVNAFLLFWGMNYGRDSLKDQQGWGGGGPIEEAEVAALAERLVDAVCASWDALPPEIATPSGSRMPWDLPTLSAHIDRGYAALDWLDYAPAREWRSPRVKPVRLLFYPFSTAGRFSPWTSEAQYDGELPEVSLPFTAAHELAHARGFAREDEANLLGIAAGLASGEPYLQYGVLRAAVNYAVNAVGGTDKQAAKALRARLPEGVRADNRVLREYWASKPDLTVALSDATYDAYLKSQGVSSGRRSYSQVVKQLIWLDRAGGLALDVSR